MNLSKFSKTLTDFSVNNVRVFVALMLGMLTTLGVVGTIEKGVSYTIVFLTILYFGLIVSVLSALLIKKIQKKYHLGNIAQIIVVTICVLNGLLLAGLLYGKPEIVGSESLSQLLFPRLQGSFTDLFLAVLLFIDGASASFYVQEWAYIRL